MSGATLADRLEVILVERGPLPACTLARELRRRTADVLDALRSDGRFAHTSGGRGSRWSLATNGNGSGPTVASFTAADAAERWRCSEESAVEILFGAEGFEARGIVERLGGNGRVRVTELGLELALGLEDAAGEWLEGVR